MKNIKTFRKVRASILNEKLKSKKPNDSITIDVDMNFEPGDKYAMKAFKKYKLKVEPNGATQVSHDMTGTKQNIIDYLQSPYYEFEDEDIKDIYPELLESVNESRKTIDPSAFTSGKLHPNDQFRGNTSLSMTLASELGFDPKKEFTEGIGFDNISMYDTATSKTIVKDALKGVHTFDELLKLAKAWYKKNEALVNEDMDEKQLLKHLEAIKKAMLKDDKRNGLIDYLEIQYGDLLQIGYSIPEQGIKRWSADWNYDGIDFSGSEFKKSNSITERRPKPIEDVEPRDAYMLFVDTLSDEMVRNNYPAI